VNSYFNNFEISSYFVRIAVCQTENQYPIGLDARKSVKEPWAYAKVIAQAHGGIPFVSENRKERVI